MKPNTPTLAITTGLISCSPGSICRHHFQLNIAVQRLYCIVGLHIKRSAQPTKLHRAPERTFAFMGIPKSLSKCHSGITPCFPNRAFVPRMTGRPVKTAIQINCEGKASLQFSGWLFDLLIIRSAYV
jgi:hypothetical protein